MRTRLGFHITRTTIVAVALLGMVGYAAPSADASCGSCGAEAGAAGIGCAGTACADKACLVGGFRLGPQAYSFNRFTVFEAIEKAREIGARVIEFYPGQALSPEERDVKFSHDSPPSVWAKVKKKLNEHGVCVLAYGVVGLGKDEAANRKVFDFATVMGIPTINSEPAAGSFPLIEKLVKEYNIRVGIHNHPKRSDNPDYKYWDPEYVLSCVKDLDARIGSCADTGHWIRSGVKPMDALKILQGRIVSMHLKDLNEFKRDAHDVPFGQGVADMKAVLDEMRRQGVDGMISLEYEHNWDNNVPDMKLCVDYVREWGK